jgi:hypothetical protein
MAIIPSALSSAAMPVAPEVPLCSTGRWVTHDEWPGWREECADPGEVVLEPPYLLCLWHAGDLAARAEGEAS